MPTLSVFRNSRELTNNFVLSREHFTGRAWNLIVPARAVYSSREMRGNFMELASVLRGHFTLSTQFRAPRSSANSRRFAATVLYLARNCQKTQLGRDLIALTRENLQDIKPIFLHMTSNFFFSNNFSTLSK